MKNNIKLIALDMDGTILDDDSKCSNRTAQALRDLIKRGVHVVFATGRTHLSAQNIADKIGISLPIISHNGAKIVDPVAGEILNKKKSLEDAKEILRYSDTENLYAKAYIDDCMYIREADKVSLDFAKNHGIHYKVIGDMGDNIPEATNMIIFIYPEPIEVDYQDIFNHLDVSITRSMPTAYEFMAKGSNKGRALKILSEHLGVKRNEILAVGNALNDLEMLEFAGTGIAMKNSDKDLLGKWDKISTYTNNEEGVYHIIKEIL